MKLIAKTYAGLEEVTAEEIKQLGGSKIEILKRAVAFEGSRYTLYATNLFLRTAIRILLPIKEATIKDEDDLYKAVYDIDWESIFDVDQTFAVYSTCNSEIFTHSQYVALKSKDAIADHFRSIDGIRPDVDKDEPDIVINIHIRHDYLTISLDSSGRSLHKRGYKIANVIAPLKETLAASLLYLSGWDRKMTLLDPMCGSGTFLTEAYLLSRGLAPQNVSRYFAFRQWKDFNQELFTRAWREETEKLEKTEPLIIGSDLSNDSIDAARTNTSELFAEEIKVDKQDFFLRVKPSEEGLIIMNPPYDLRLGEEDIIGFYKKIGDTLKKSYTGWRACILSGHLKAIKHVGLKPTRRYSVMNGPLPAKFFIFDIYDGSKKE